MPEDYRIISSNKAEITILKPSTLLLDGNLSRVWVVALRAPGREATGASVIHLKEEFDCKGQRVRILNMATYARDNTYIQSQDFTVGDLTWITITPESQGEQVARFVCGDAEARERFPAMEGLSLGQIVSSTFSGEWPGK